MGNEEASHSAEEEERSKDVKRIWEGDGMNGLLTDRKRGRSGYVFMCLHKKSEVASSWHDCWLPNMPSHYFYDDDLKGMTHVVALVVL